MAVTFENIKEAKKGKENLQADQGNKQKERVLRPWESYKNEPDLIELITERNVKTKVKKNNFKKTPAKKATKEETPKVDEAEDLEAKLEKAKLKYFGDLI